ncbi:hypothetical protein D3C78_1515470 [compost metagenome]
MLQEAIQLLSTAHFEIDGVQRGAKPTHKNHPSAIFTRESKANYNWVLSHAKCLNELYTERTGKVHGYQKYLDQVLEAPHNFQKEEQTDFPMCMPDEVKLKSLLDVHGAYRIYLNTKYKEWLSRNEFSEKRPVKVEFFGAKPSWVEV